MTRGLVIGFLFVLGCDSSPSDEAARYLSDAGFRRQALTVSLIADNRYSALRLAHYGRDWDELPVWNPAVETLDEDFAPSGDERVLSLDDPKLGEAAFFLYPAQALPGFESESALANGLDYAPGFGGGVVWVRYADGRRGAALSCASCHARVVDNVLVPGLANQDLALGDLLHASWPRGQLDVSATLDEAPVAIPDLRSVTLQANLQAAGAVKNGRIALAIRIETLLITAHGQVLRPPREIALALADYLRSLTPAPVADATSHGAIVFAQRCAHCHAGEAMAGSPIDVDLIGTDASVARSLDRGTGGYRAPSLRGVASRGALLHDASVTDLDAFFDPRRTGGHRFGLDLGADDRAALLGYLRTR